MLGKGLGAPGGGREGGVARHVRERLEVGLFLAGLLALAFGYGVAVGKGPLFPHVLINNAVDAARDWRENWRQYLGLRSEFVLPSARTAAGVPRYDRAAAWPGYTFLTMFHDHRFGGGAGRHGRPCAAPLGRRAQPDLARPDGVRWGEAGRRRRRHPR